MRATPYGSVREDDIRRSDIKTSEGGRRLKERLNDKGSLVTDGQSNLWAFGFLFKNDATGVSSLGAEVFDQLAKSLPAFIIVVSAEGEIKLFAGHAEPIAWLKSERDERALQLPLRYPPSLKVSNGDRHEDLFLGRAGDLKDLLSWICPGKGEGSEREAEPEPYIVVSGVEGVGKSCLVCEALHRCYAPLTKIWLDASSREALDKTVKEVCTDLKQAGVSIENEGDHRRQLHDWLDSNSSWVLVLDGLGDKELIWESGESKRHLVPKNHKGTVIFTTRIEGFMGFPLSKEITLRALQIADAA
eukprot:Cvel_16992.t2-p1 / transcript=Cvel_16992.t2 / gene=Cvel_16992 / organism=Chromera_velia_CCMP2878 / gene_product=hypothetical protein / transcript_product=hypothetical protein / location=Cvel_scaffold1335:5203-6105(+) / protein_length=301 / sequence_SO=supercontig / SO=protein_coding / is_pseudo=false